MHIFAIFQPFAETGKKKAGMSIVDGIIKYILTA
jgi:hypothetical protein